MNGIAPGPIERTGGADKLWQSEEAAKRTIESIPLGRLGKPEEIAELAAFIMSDKASYMNGEIVTLDGGQWLNQISVLRISLPILHILLSKGEMCNGYMEVPLIIVVLIICMIGFISVRKWNKANAVFERSG